MQGNDNERDQLGELPPDLLRERGEDTMLNDRPGSLPPDMARSDAVRKAAAEAGIGGPVLDYGVRGVYDSRPVNAIDFNQTYLLNLANAYNFVAQPAMLQVPQGRVAVLRRVEFSDPGSVTGIVSAYTFPSVVADNLLLVDYYVQVLRNAGVVQPIDMRVPGTVGFNYKDAIPIKGGDSIDTFLIYDEGEQIGLNFYLSSAAVGEVFVKLYGNLLPKTGVPANFEIANKAAGTPARVMASQADLQSAPSLADSRGASPMGRNARTVTGERVGVPPRRPIIR
jgi:hypothetical protein